MATRFTFKPFGAEFPTSNAAVPSVVNRRPVLSFDPTTDQTAYWTDIAPQGLTGALTVVITYMMASATTGAVGLQAQIEAVSDSDTVDLDATTSFDSVNNSASVTVPGTAGYIDQVSIAMTNADGMVAADYFRLSINRDADGSAITDDAAGNLYILAVELRDAA